MNKKKYILFDLDGTVTDSAPGIINSVIYALRHYGIEETNREKVRAFVGPPLIDSFERIYGFDEEKAREAMHVYREYFGDRGIFENEVYPGIEEMLSALGKAGKTLLIATSKPEVYTRRILEHFSLSRYFDHICGATFDERVSKKADVIEYALNTAGITDRSLAVMVGDRDQDVIGAKQRGLECIGVRWGYAVPGELEDAGADVIVDSVDALTAMLL